MNHLQLFILLLQLIIHLNLAFVRDIHLVYKYSLVVWVIYVAGIWSCRAKTSILSWNASFLRLSFEFWHIHLGLILMFLLIIPVLIVTGGLGIMNCIRVDRKLVVMVIDYLLVLLLIGTTHIFNKSNSLIGTPLFAVTKELLLLRNVLHRHDLALSALFGLITIVSCMGSTIVSHDAWLFTYVAEIMRLVPPHLVWWRILCIHLLVAYHHVWIITFVVESGCLFSWLHRRELLLILLSSILNHFRIKLLIKILVLLSTDANVAASHFLLMHLRVFWWSLVRDRFWSFMNQSKILLQHGWLTSNHIFVHLLLLLLNQIVIELSVTQIFSCLTTYQVIFLLMHVTWSRFECTLSPLNWCIIFGDDYLVVDPHLISVILASHVLVCWQEIIQILLLLVLLLVLSNNWSRLTLVLLSWYESPRLILQKHIIVWLYPSWCRTNCLMRVHLMLIII